MDSSRSFRPARENPWWIPPFLGGVPDVEPRLVRLLGLVSLALFFEQYDNSMLTSALKYIADDLGMAEDQLGWFLALVRLGAVPAFLIVPFADALRAPPPLSRLGHSLQHRHAVSPPSPRRRAVRHRPERHAHLHDHRLRHRLRHRHRGVSGPLPRLGDRHARRALRLRARARRGDLRRHRLAALRLAFSLCHRSHSAAAAAAPSQRRQRDGAIPSRASEGTDADDRARRLVQTFDPPGAHASAARLRHRRRRRAVLDRRGLGLPVQRLLRAHPSRLDAGRSSR